MLSEYCHEGIVGFASWDWILYSCIFNERGGRRRGFGGIPTDCDWKYGSIAAAFGDSLAIQRPRLGHHV